jgi:hypothetical protein
MLTSRSRRSFLADVGRGTLLATLGPAMVADLGLAPRAFAEELDSPLEFGDLEPLVCELQETPIERLQTTLAGKLRGGLPLKTLVAAGALSNARTFGGEDYVGFHTFMALGPSMKMASLMPTGEEALPVFKVLYRNGSRIEEFGGRESETLHGLSASTPVSEPTAVALQDAIRSKDATLAEQILSSLVSNDRLSGLDALLPMIQENPEVHRTVLPYRAWDMQEIVGTQHALTLLRQSLRYCVRAEPHRRAEWSENSRMLVGLLDEFHLAGREPGTKPAEDSYVEHLSQTFSTASPADSARAAATALAEGFDPSVVGEAISLAASMLVLRDRGRLPQWEDRLKPAGSVHGDSIGVHASDSANAWRNLARVSKGRNVFACLIVGAWQVARDRDASPGNLLAEPLPVKHHLDRISATDADGLLAKLDEAVQNNLQGNATAIAHRYGELALPADRLFGTLLKYAVSEDGALHAEKYFQTVRDDFSITRPSLRWRHMASLARVTASEFGKPAPGQTEARELLGLVGTRRA